MMSIFPATDPPAELPVTATQTILDLDVGFVMIHSANHLPRDSQHNTKSHKTRGILKTGKQGGGQDALGQMEQTRRSSKLCSWWWLTIVMNPIARDGCTTARSAAGLSICDPSWLQMGSRYSARPPIRARSAPPNLRYYIAIVPISSARPNLCRTMETRQAPCSWAQ